MLACYIFYHYSKITEHCTLKIKPRFHLHGKFVSYGRDLVWSHLLQKRITLCFSSSLYVGFSNQDYPPQLILPVSFL